MSIEHSFIYRSFWPKSETINKFKQIGVHKYCIYPANNTNYFGQPYCLYDPIWKGPGVYDFVPLKKHIDDIVSVDPEAQFVCMIDLNTPLWWCHMHFAPDTFSDLGLLASDPEWRNDTQAYMNAFLEFTETHYGDRIFAYLLSCGGTCEWFDRSKGAESPSRNIAYREWCDENGYDIPADIPPQSVRDHITHEFLRDPERDADGVKFWRFVSDQIADTIIFFANQFRKSAAAKKQLGVFYGYNKIVIQCSSGFLALEKVLDTGLFDFIVEVNAVGAGGGPAGQIVPLESIRRRNVVCLHEIDQRTHTSNKKPYLKEGFDIEWSPAWPDEKATIACLKREMATCLIDDASLWWFDMWGGWYEGENVYATLQRCREIWDSLKQEKFVPKAEILLVSDPDSYVYVKELDPHIQENNAIFKKLRKSGVLSTECLFNDLPKMDLSNYKMIIFNDLFAVDDDKLEILNKYVLKEQRTIIWNMASGIIRNGKYSPGYVSELTGLSSNAQGISSKQMTGWTSVYCSLPEYATSAFFRENAKSAGVHVYMDDDVYLLAHSDLLMVHSASSGIKKVQLPCMYSRVTELFSNRIVGENIDSFTDDMDFPDTLLYKLEK